MNPTYRTVLDNTYIDATDPEAVHLYNYLAELTGIKPYIPMFQNTQVIYFEKGRDQLSTWVGNRDFKKVHPYCIPVSKSYLKECIDNTKNRNSMKQESNKPVAGDLVEIITNESKDVYLGYFIGVSRDGRSVIETLKSEWIYRTSCEIRKVEPNPVDEFKTKNNLEDVDDKTIEVLLSKGLIK